MIKKATEGYKVVLTADRTLMSEYSGGVFLGFSACVPKGLIPDWLYFSIFCPSVPVNEDGSVRYAPCGTRKVEAALLSHGFKDEDVIVAHPEHLDKVVGPKTKVVGITETDPLGNAPATSTFTQLFNGEAYMNIKFRELLNHPAIRRYRPRIVVGGPGAWQLEDETIRSKKGINRPGSKNEIEKSIPEHRHPSINYSLSFSISRRHFSISSLFRSNGGSTPSGRNGLSGCSAE